MSSARAQRLKVFRRLLKEYGKLLAVISIPAIVWALIIIQGDMARAKHARLVEEVRAWPVTDAVILSFKMVDSEEGANSPTPDPLQASLRVGYTVNGEKMEADYSAAWIEREAGEWIRRYTPGKKIPIRVDPANPARISLWDHNGIP